MDAQQFANQLQQRKQKNLAFFKRYFPNIHDTFANLSLKNAQLNIDPNTLEVNLVENGKAIYPLNAKETNINEARQFSDAFKPGFMNHPLRRSTPNDFYRGRFAHGSIANFLEAVQPVAEAIKPYTFRESLPQVVFLGSGLGLHISAFLEMRPVKHAVLVEHNPDRFLASLYLTDWEAIITPYIEDQTRSFVLSVGDTTELSEDERVHQGFAGAWNTICLNVPFMPVQTVFYIHQADPFYTKVANRLNDEIEPYINVWGFYDDEINQLNQVLHNFSNGIRIFNKVDMSDLENPIVICGNGPSLDEYIDVLKENRSKVHIVAAGSAVHSLLKNGIEPDFMVAMESDYDAYDAYKKLLNPEQSRNIPIICTAQVHPKTFDLFSDGLVYLKDETTYARLLENKYTCVSGGTPSASNAALAITLELNPPEIFLIGMDFGFKDPRTSHSSSSFYSEKENEERFSDFFKQLSKESYKVETNKNGDIYTTAFYNTGRVHAQRKIIESGRKDIINLSAGATISGTKWGNIDNLIDAIKNKKNIPDKLFTKIKKNSKSISKEKTNDIPKKINKILKKYTNDILPETNTLEPNIDSIETILFRINQKTINNKDSDVSKFNMFIRGTIWHWIFNYYALCKEFDSEIKLVKFTKEFKTRFSHFLKNMPAHFSEFISDRSENDPKIKIQLDKPEPNIDKWFY